MTRARALWGSVFALWGSVSVLLGRWTVPAPKCEDVLRVAEGPGDLPCPEPTFLDERAVGAAQSWVVCRCPAWILDPVEAPVVPERDVEPGT